MSTKPEITATFQTPPGKGGIAVIALRGRGVEDILSKVFRPRHAATPSMDTLQLGHIVAGEEIIDEALVTLSPRGAEINIHGGPIAARRTLLRLAETGVRICPSPEEVNDAFEPSHPKWHNPAIGRELMASLPSAASGLVAEGLSLQWSGGLSQLAREAISCSCDSQSLAAALCEAARDFTTMQRLLYPAEVVLAGPPNAGKSTLGNSLVGRPVSLVHGHAGTTRDWIRERAIIRGVPIYITDTAGLWEPDHPIDAESVRRSWEWLERADLILLLGAGETIDLPDWVHARTLRHVATKIDSIEPAGPADVCISTHTGEGMEEMREMMLHALGLDAVDPHKAMAFTARQESHLLAAGEAITQKKHTEAKTQLYILLEGE